MGFKDLREYIEQVDSSGELRRIEGADWDLEMGAITEVAASSPACPMLLFDKIKGYKPGYRVVTNLLHTEKRLALAIGESPNLRGVGLVRKWRQKMGEIAQGLPPVEVGDGPIQENIQTGSDVNILEFPVAKWHELDGGRYIPGAVSIMKDAEEEYVNLGVYRLQVHDKSTLGIWVSPGKDAREIMRRYWKRGESCPIAISLGNVPGIFLAGAMSTPFGITEYQVAGAINGSPISVLRGKYTQLPVPATSEVVLEGEIPPQEVESREEGPFGEATGYYATGARPEPIVKVKCIMYRHNPIMQGAPPMKPLRGMFHIPLNFGCAPLWQELEACGMHGIQGIWQHSRGVTVISLKQMYAGHAKQVALSAAGSRNTCMSRVIITVDEDIDPCNLTEVMWAISHRCDPDQSVEIIKDCWVQGIDPLLTPERRALANTTGSKVIMNACTPRYRAGGFPPVVEASSAMKAQVLEKWAELKNEAKGGVPE
ncbi:UbiD family decarboxylase [Chloroflexota bacterium]